MIIDSNSSTEDQDKRYNEIETYFKSTPWLCFNCNVNYSGCEGGYLVCLPDSSYPNWTLHEPLCFECYDKNVNNCRKLKVLFRSEKSEE